jgi:hypothetical protein
MWREFKLLTLSEIYLYSYIAYGIIHMSRAIYLLASKTFFV